MRKSLRRSKTLVIGAEVKVENKVTKEGTLVVEEAKQLDPKGIVNQMKQVVQEIQEKDSIKGAEVIVKIGDLDTLPP